MSLKITLIGVNFFPEDTAIGLYSTQMAQYLESRGHQLNIISGFPYYPQWKIQSEYVSKPKYVEETIGKIRVLRYRQYVPEKPTFFKRILHLVDFTFGSFRNAAKIKQTDLIICVVPFTSTIVLGLWLKWRRKSKLWVHIQDFEFDAAMQSGLSKDKSAIRNLMFKALFSIERILLNQADIASTISITMLEKLKSKSYIPTVFFPNWIDVDKINPDTSSKHAYLNSEKFKILYSGNIGDKQDWELFIALVNALNSREDIEFVVVGDGSKYAWLSKELSRNSLVTFYKPVKYEELSDLLCSADLHVLFQKADVVDTVMPSKLLGMMASRKPSIVTGNPLSEVKTVLEKSNGGIYLACDEVDTLVSTIYGFMEDHKMAKTMGENARNYVVKTFEKQAILSGIEQKILEIHA